MPAGQAAMDESGKTGAGLIASIGKKESLNNRMTASNLGLLK